MSSQANSQHASQEEIILEAMKHPHPKTFTPLNLIVLILCGVLGSVIGMETIVNLGSTPNTSIIGALIAVIIGLIPLKAFRSYKNIHTQNLIETGISASTFGAGNVMFYALAIMWLLGLKEAMMPMIVGASIGLIIDISVLYWNFDTPLLPASKAWPLGIATAETLLAAKEKGKKAVVMLIGGVFGAGGAYFGLPTDIMGICFFGNVWALSMFCVGLIFRGWFAPNILNLDINALYIPHGIMLGAGMAALIQIAFIIFRRKNKTPAQPAVQAAESSATDLAGGEVKPTRSTTDLGKGMTKGFVCYLLGAVVIAALSGLFYQMPVLKLIWWIMYAAIAAIVSELMCGISSMNAGWFPGTATVLIFLVVGTFFNFPILGLGLLVGYTSSTGPAFSDMGYDLKCGWILRGKGINPKFELEGRREQYRAELVGAAVAIVMSVVAYTAYFSADRFPPVARVFATTIEAGSNPDIVRNLVIFAIIGAAIQFAGGANRQLGVLLGNGLLILNLKAGIFGLIAILVRILFEKTRDKGFNEKARVFAAGLVAGCAMFSFFNSTVQVMRAGRD